MVTQSAAPRLHASLDFSSLPQHRKRGREARGLMILEEAADVGEMAAGINELLRLGLNLERVAFIRSRGSRSLAVARTFGTPIQWRFVLKPQILYIIEVISERFDSLSCEDKAYVVLHELLHIPPRMSGGLRNHGHPAFRQLSRNRGKLGELCRQCCHNRE